MPSIKAGKESVEITDAQLKELDLDPDQDPLGCGQNACAYLARDGETVVKITKDTKDAMTSYVLMGCPGASKWAIPIHGVYRLPRPSSAYYVIISGFAEKLPQEWARPLDEIYEEAVKANLQPEEWEDFYEELHDIYEENGDARSLQALELIDQAMRGFGKFGFDWVDFHSGNWGMWKERPVVIDLGMSFSLKRPPVAVLNENGMPD